MLSINCSNALALVSRIVWLVLLSGMPAELLAGGTWTALNNAPPVGVNNCLLMSDGTVLGMNGAGQCVQLAPDSAGSYRNGTWIQLSTMNDARMFFASQVLTNGRVFVAGGEYGPGHDHAELYDPQNNIWTGIPDPVPGVGFSDAVSEMLPNGNVLVAPVSQFGGCLVYNVVSNSWQTAASALNQNEVCWVKLPNDNILTIDTGAQTSEHYVPSINQWIKDNDLPVPVYGYGAEIGAGFLLPNGKAFYIGGSTNTAIYTPGALATSAGSWIAGPPMVFGTNQLGAVDAPASMMVNGKILCDLGPVGGFNGPCFFYEYDYAANIFTQVSAPGGGSTYNSVPYANSMLNLPTGEVLFVGGQNSRSLYIYTPDGTPFPAGKPGMNSITENLDGSYHLVGTNLNGITMGAAYGDDAQMSCNYPLVRLTNSTSGNVYYARTYNWNNTGVMKGSLAVSSEFSLPQGLPPGNYTLVAVVNGNVSAPVNFTYAPPPAPTGLAGSAGNGQAVLSWNSVSGATSYNIKRLTSGNPDYYVTVGTVTGNSFTNSGLVNLYTYTYEVTAIGPNGESSGSAPVAVTPLGLPGSTTGITAYADTFARITLNWTPSPGTILYYNIKRSITPNGPYVTIATTPNPFYTDSGLTLGKTYYYVVSTVNYYGEGGNSIAVNATPQSIANFGFEQPPYTTGQHFYSPTNGIWQFSGASPSGSGMLANSSAFGNANAPEGLKAAFLQETGSISQTLSGFLPGTTYVLTYSAAQRSGNNQTWNVLIDNLVVQAVTSPGGSSYANYTATFVATSPVHKLSFVGTDIPGGDNTVFLDDIAIWPSAPSYGGNFGFEAPSVANYQYNPSGGTWTFSGSSGNGSGIVANGSGFSNPNAPQGVQAAFVQGYGSVLQTLSNLTPGTTYTVSYLAAQRGGANQHGGQTWNVIIDSTVIQANNVPGGTSYTPYSATFVATSSSHVLKFVGTDLPGGDNTVFIDNVIVGAALQPLPPPTVVLGGLTNGALLNYQATLNLSANVMANSNSISSVQYLYDVTNVLAAQLTVPPYNYTWNSSLQGTHSVFARVYFNNGNYADSPAATVTFFTALPVTATDVVGSQVKFVATTSEFDSISYQWQKISGGVTNNIPGATNAALVLSNLQLGSAASYRVLATNLYGSTASAARTLTVNNVPSPVNNVITAMAAQTGTGSGIFTPTWTFDGDSLIFGQLPSTATGNFSLEVPGRTVASLTAGDGLGLSVINGTSGITCSTDYVTCGNGYGAGSSLVYTLTGYAGGYNLTNITVYGGWADDGRDQQAYTVSYSKVSAPSTFITLTTVNYNPSNPAKAQSATRARLVPASGYLATNVAAVKFNFTTPSSENGYCGYGEIQMFGAASIPPAVPTSVEAGLNDANNLVLNVGGMVIGRNYEVQSTTNLTSGVWTTETSFTATTTAVSITNSTSGADQKFYRINGY